MTPGNYVKKGIFVPFFLMISLSSKAENIILRVPHRKLELKVAVVLCFVEIYFCRKMSDKHACFFLFRIV